MSDTKPGIRVRRYEDLEAKERKDEPIFDDTIKDWDTFCRTLEPQGAYRYNPEGDDNTELSWGEARAILLGLPVDSVPA